MATLFLSDLHLDPSRNDIAAVLTVLTALLRGPARQAEALYVLGDLFEAWIGDDDQGPLAAAIAAEFAMLATVGVPVYFQHGNRDFLIGGDYAARAGLQLLGEQHRIDLYGVPTLLLHGDTLCSDDHDYQRLRLAWRDPVWQAAFLALPLDQRRAFAARARVASRAHTATASSAIMDVNAAAVGDCFRAHQVTRIIHGHTHRPAIHPPQDIDGRACQRIVLGDWHRCGSVLRVSAGAVELLELPLPVTRDPEEPRP